MSTIITTETKYLNYIFYASYTANRELSDNPKKIKSLHYAPERSDMC